MKAHPKYFDSESRVNSAREFRNVDFQLEGRVAIVTGASKGLGEAIVRAYVGEGMRVVAAARNADALSALAKEFPDSIRNVTCDVSDLDQVAHLADVAVDSFGELDVIVSNAGIAPASAFVDMPLSTWNDVFGVNIFAPVALAKAAGTIFLAQGHGKVINIASTSGLRGKPQLAAYSSSKGAILRFTEALAGEWASSHIQVNAIAPGAFATDAQRAVLEDSEILRRRLRKIPSGRMGAVEEIGALACYLASPLSDFVTGATYVIDGGESAKL
jgi:2-deoxy-D-gluconate 3-dehydrogenase